MELAFPSAAPRGCPGAPAVHRSGGRPAHGPGLAGAAVRAVGAPRPRGQAAVPGGQPIFGGGALVGRVQISPRTSLFLGAGGSPLFNQPAPRWSWVPAGAGGASSTSGTAIRLRGGGGRRGHGFVRPARRCAARAGHGRRPPVHAPRGRGRRRVGGGNGAAIPAWHEGRASWVEARRRSTPAPGCASTWPAISSSGRAGTSPCAGRCSIAATPRPRHAAAAPPAGVTIRPSSPSRSPTASPQRPGPLVTVAGLGAGPSVADVGAGVDERSAGSLPTARGVLRIRRRGGSGGLGAGVGGLEPCPGPGLGPAGRCARPRPHRTTGDP
jgi:hypothetical protein